MSLLKDMDESRLRLYYGVLLHDHAGSNRYQQSKTGREWNESSYSAAHQRTAATKFLSI